MARTIHLPGLARLCIADRRDEILALADHPKLLRGGSPTGPLLNTYVLKNINRALRFGDVVLPSASPRDDNVRAMRQSSLSKALDPPKIDWSIVPIDELAAHVGGSPGLPVGLYCQRAAGRAFFAGYEATSATWEAARTLDKAVRSLNPLVHWWQSLTGSLVRAQRTLIEAAQGDAACAHATGVAVHTLVAAIERLRDDFNDQAKRRTSPEQIVRFALLGPASVVRHTLESVDDLPHLSIPANSLVLMKVAQASIPEPGPELAFLSTSWSACPADRYVFELAKKIWSQALSAHDPGTD